SEVKREFHELIKGADAAEVAAMEQAMIETGTPVEEVQRLCEVHADLFRAGLERGEKADRMPGHPVHTYRAENQEARKRLRPLRLAALAGGLDALARAADSLRLIIVHYQRKENQLFPFLERTGFTGPSKVMWGKHDEIREAFRELDAAIQSRSAGLARKTARALARKIAMMIFMEEKILLPNALKRLSDADWAAVRRGEDAIGFAWVKPGAQYDPALVNQGGMYANFQAAADSASSQAGQDQAAGIRLSEGSLPLDILDLMLRHLPLDVSFVDADDKVRYYSDSPHRVFPRSPAIIGRDVRNCHPHKSVAVVERILEAFKRKEKDTADFWLEVGGRFVYITYKPLYAADGSYLGTMEVSMDATELRGLTGTRTLLDW
ncbi:MAG: DUF438 domain-containing protein, partial [Spirochaetia bacterium]|nr:DUF438 domain-containing protein [Spirochaetia bacterium]